MTESLEGGQLATGSTAVPLYQQVKDFITARIESGDWPPGCRIPSENDIVASLGVSRMTAHRAVRELSAEGRLDRVQGVGTFVAARREPSALLEIRSIAREIAERGGSHSATVISADREAANDEAARMMQLAPEALVFHVVVVHRENGRPIQLEDRYVNPGVAPKFLDQDFTRITPSQYLTDHVTATEVEHVIEARRPEGAEYKLLEIDRYEPCLVLRRRTWSLSRVVTRVKLVHPGNLYRLGGRFKPAGAARTLVA
ncbi:MAG: histidine utilization repressor [Alphaproteobacteria bacterium]|nr:histidine utilization repressor [Alphaproteobacteria bacterium]